MEGLRSADKRRKKRKRGRKPAPPPPAFSSLRPLTWQHLDGRSQARKQFDAISRGIAADLGGEDQLSTVQKHLVEAFAGVAIHVNNLNARLLMGEPIDIITHSQAISAMVRVASRVGLYRVAREITPDPLTYAAEHEDAS